MQQYSCSVRLGGSTQHVVTNKVVTIPEIAVLKRVHGSDAICDLRPSEAVRRSDAEERERLKKLYDTPTPDSSPLIDALFGPMGPLPKALATVGIDARQAALEAKARAEQAIADAEALEAEVAALPVDEDDDSLEGFED